MNQFIKAICLLSLCLVPALSWADCDLDKGKKQFNKCSACHSLEPDVHMMGPSLHGLMGRKVGTAQGFVFSQAMEGADFEWTPELLSSFLEDPAGTVPGTVMPFGGIKKADQRKVLVCYIEQMSQ
jgi:cytochrome c2